MGIPRELKELLRDTVQLPEKRRRVALNPLNGTQTQNKAPKKVTAPLAVRIRHRTKGIHVDQR